MTETLFLPAREARSVRMNQGDTIRVINTYGSQVVDTWAFTGAFTGAFRGTSSENDIAAMSMEHTRVHADHPTPRLGTVFLTTKRAPVLKMTADTSPGVHDWFYAACDCYRYEMLGFEGLHDNCTDNLKGALSDEGIDLGFTPCPLNLFQNVSLVAKGSTEIEPPLGRPGDYVDLTALADALIVFSACPQDMAATNGADMTPKDVMLEVYRR